MLGGGGCAGAGEGGLDLVAERGVGGVVVKEWPARGSVLRGYKKPPHLKGAAVEVKSIAARAQNRSVAPNCTRQRLAPLSITTPAGAAAQVGTSWPAALYDALPMMRR